jgi:alpha-glucuronidase
MAFSRRELLAASGVAGLAAFYAGCASRVPYEEEVTGGGGADEDGSRLWLRYARLPRAVAMRYERALRGVRVEGDSATSRSIRKEVELGFRGMLGREVSWGGDGSEVKAGTVLIGTPGTSGPIRELKLEGELAEVGPEGFLIRSVKYRGKPVWVIASEGELGALYGTFHLLRMMQTHRPVEKLEVASRPRLQLRMLNHWDNLDGSIERGYGGRSNWKWEELPGKLSPRYTMYGRACASLGLNGAVLNNVNASDKVLTAEYLEKIAALAGVWRPYGVRVYLSAFFAAPKTLGGLGTADPLDPGVAAWWKAKAEEIYARIPDFGGFLVKANSEGQPGPKDYHRSHAEGANMLADAVAAHGGTVIWRAFTYDDDIDPDRAKRAYIEFTRLDGQFRRNVLLQVKNGAIDFQPREPFHPLFGGLKQTPCMLEVQPTQEYLGQAKHLVYLGTMWKECLDSDTYAKGKGSTVGRVIEGKVFSSALTGMAGVLNTGTDANWCGHDFSQANWYALGRLAWDHELGAREIAEEWVRQTFTNEEAAVGKITEMMMSSREAFVNYTMPLGLHHLIGGNHYAPMPQNDSAPRRDWTATYYHRAAVDGIGFDRTRKGDGAVEQYYPEVCDTFDNLATCPEIFLLWFHRVAWDYRLKDGKTLWEGLCDHYFRGAAYAREMQAIWAAMKPAIDAQRHRAVSDRLEIQVQDAARWRDQILAYFQRFSRRPIVGGG